MYVLIVNTNIGALNDAVNCAFCAPGFKPTYTNNFVTACTEIQNCNSSSQNPWVNACSECEENFTWEFDTNNDEVDYTSCVSSGT